VRELVKPVIAFSLGALLVSCSSNPEPRVLPELLAGKPVCLAVDWGTVSGPTYSGRPAPDTLLLLPGRGERRGPPEGAERWGDVALAPSQRDRQGSGWSWWTVGDTLVIRGWSVTEEDLIVQAVKSDAKFPATWLSTAMGTTRKRGSAYLHEYPCP
jgi:hypothetical protein